MRAIPKVAGGHPHPMGARVRRTLLPPAAVLVALALGGAGAGCGATRPAGGGRPPIVVTTPILGDVVAEIAGRDRVLTVMPPGASPHDFQPSPRDVAALRAADAIVVNGAGFEAGLLDIVGQAEADGVPTFVAASAASAPSAAPDGSAAVGAGERGPDDPHFFTDPLLMAKVVRALGPFLVEHVPGLDRAEVDRRTRTYLQRLDDLHTSVAAILETVAPGRRILVTNHDEFGAFAERYGFDIVGTVLPGRSTAGAASAAGLAGLVATLERTGAPAIFVDSSAPADLARTVAAEVGGVQVVVLYAESLGPPTSEAATYLGMVRTNATRIATALGGAT